VERRRHWWNGRFAKPSRRDVFLWRDDGRWHVEARRGGLDRRSRLFAFDDEAAALTLVEALVGSDVEGWRQVGL
jgi:hypothetical protein